MARLNDPPPPPIESVEALKRRFTRQNRDFARINTSQAVRIRNLEAETVRLVRENLSLREDLIASQEECLRLKRTESLDAEILEYRNKLQAKIAELSSHVEELGRLPEKVRQKERTERRRTQVKLEPSSPTKEAWKSRQLNPPSLQDQDNLLPPIAEDKTFPRISLDSIDLQNIIHNGLQPLDSPEIGPPPTTQFADLDDSPHVESAEQGTTEDQPILQNVEKRRKRRTSSLISDMDNGQTSTENSESDTKVDPVKRMGKRKLDASELDQENGQHSSLAKAEDDFVYQRKPALKPSTSRKSSRFSRPADRDVTDSPSSQPSSPQKERKALAPISTNSPSKRVVDAKNAGKPIDRPLNRIRRPASTTRDRRNVNGDSSAPSRRRPVEARAEPAPPSEELDREPEVTSDPELPPKTPFLPDDLFSPPSSQASGPQAARVKQEAVIMNSVEDVLNGSIGRGTRRAKAAVSYAEPSLRDKMRRPGKELVGAVEGYERKNRDGSLTVDKTRASTEDIGQLNSHQRSGLNRMEEPGSPLHEKQAANEKRKRETIDIQRWAQGEQQALPPVTSSSRRRSSDISGLEASISGLSIFDPPASSPSGDSSTIEYAPPAPSGATTKKLNSTRATTSTTTSRRHSLQPTSRLSTTATASNPTISRRVSLASSTYTSRPSSASSNHSNPKPSSSTSTHLAHRRRPSTTSSSTTTLAKPSDVNPDDADADIPSDNEQPTSLSLAADTLESGSLRATRRKSMVV